MLVQVRESSSSLALASREPTGQLFIPTLSELLTADPDRFVATYSYIAVINLVCATGLPNSEEIEIPIYLTLLDKMAQAVRSRTEKSWRLFKLKPSEFNNSENVFRVLTMEHVLRTQFGVKYNEAVYVFQLNGKIWDTEDSSELFIHGILGEGRMGTCSSLPVFAIAVGRRVGYPLKLLRVPNHCLFRWDDGGEKFNVQHTFAGSEIKPDEYFYEWPRHWDEIDHQFNARTKVWLHSMTPRQEASKFLCNRALCLRTAHRYQEALQALDAAERFDPTNPAVAEIQFDIQQKMTGGVSLPSLPEAKQPHLQIIPIENKPKSATTAYTVQLHPHVKEKS